MSGKTHYTLNHILSYLRNIACIGIISWVAVKLESGWPLLAILLCMGGYKHDFKESDYSNAKLTKFTSEVSK